MHQMEISATKVFTANIGQARTVPHLGSQILCILGLDTQAHLAENEETD